MAKMQSDGTDVASSFRSTLGFSSRADQIFGALGSPSFEGASESTIAPWTVSQDRVFRFGKEAYSSDEDEEAKEIDRRQKDILPESMQELAGEWDRLTCLCLHYDGMTATEPRGQRIILMTTAHLPVQQESPDFTSSTCVVP